MCCYDSLGGELGGVDAGWSAANGLFHQQPRMPISHYTVMASDLLFLQFPFGLSNLIQNQIQTYHVFYLF